MTTRPAPVKKPAVKRTATASTTAKVAPTRRSASKTPPASNADSPILPVDQLDALRKIKPDAVEWVIQQTQIEAEHRRAETTRVNDLIFIEHLMAQISALLIGVAGIWGGSWVAINGQPLIGFAIAAVVVTALAVVQLVARKKRQ